MNGSNGGLADSGGPEIFDYVATTGGGATSGNQFASGTGAGGATIEEFVNAGSETSTALPSGNFSFPAESPETSDFDTEV